jgi:phospholipid-binding lipoprotein MlaA
MNSRGGSGWRSVSAAALLVVAALAAGGCATTRAPSDSGGVFSALGQVDPLEPYNRAMFSINDALDKAVLKPIAIAYQKVVPETGRRMIGNVFSNIGDVWVSVNNLLQGRFGDSASDLGRFAVNSTVGIFGLFDVASDMGLEKHYEDLGLTLGRWGALPGPYIVLPLFGPSTLRDGIGFAVQYQTDPLQTLDSAGQRNNLSALRLIDTREGLLAAEKLLDAAALDRYLFVRDSYLQRRRYLVYEGKSPYGE